MIKRLVGGLTATLAVAACSLIAPQPSLNGNVDPCHSTLGPGDTIQPWVSAACVPGFTPGPAVPASPGVYDANHPWVPPSSSQVRTPIHTPTPSQS